MADTEALPRIPIDEEERLRTLTKAQRDAYRRMMSEKYSYVYANYSCRFETLAAVVDAGLAEWRSQFPWQFPEAQHYIVPLGTPTHEQLRDQQIARQEAALRNRAQAVLDRANHLNIVGDRVDETNLRDLVVEIIRELEPNGQER